MDVALELIGLAKTTTQAIDCLGILGRAVVVGLNGQAISLDTYRQILANETELIGCNDHHLSELHHLVELVRTNALNTSRVVSGTIPLEATAINERLDALEQFTNDVRVVIVP